MKFRGHSNGLAIAVAGLAVVLAVTGTAYAVTSSKVTITDPTAPTRYAHLDQNRRLSVVGAASSINVYANVGFDAVQALTSPTTATLLVSAQGMSNPGLNSAYSGTTFSISLVKIRAGSTGKCAVGTDGAVVEAYLGTRLLDPGDDTEISYPAPLVVRPTGTKKYCLGVQVGHLGTGQTTLYLATYQLSGYVSSGTYTGLGLGATSATAARPGTRLVSR